MSPVTPEWRNVEPPVAASGTKVRRAGGNRFWGAHGDRLPGDRLPDDPRVELPDDRDQLLPLRRDPQRLHVRFEMRVELLDHHHAGDPGGEFPEEPHRERPRAAELHEPPRRAPP